MVPRCSVTRRTARTRLGRHHACSSVSAASLQVGGTKKGEHDMVLKGFSYAMIGAFAGGLAMTVFGSAGVLMGL